MLDSASHAGIDVGVGRSVDRLISRSYSDDYTLATTVTIETIADVYLKYPYGFVGKTLYDEAYEAGETVIDKIKNHNNSEEE